MNQHLTYANEVGMEILNLENVDRYGCFKDLVLNFLNNDIFAIDQNQDVACTEIDCIGPSLYRRVERVGRCRDDLFTVDKDMNQLIAFSDLRFNNLFQCNFAGLLIPCPDHIASLMRNNVEQVIYT